MAPELTFFSVLPTAPRPRPIPLPPVANAVAVAPAATAPAGVPRCRALDAGARRFYLRVLTWAFTLLDSVRVLSYLPTMWAIQASGDSSQHSLLTWGTWLGANLTMAACLRETGGGKCNKAIAVNLANSTMCVATIALIAWHRF